MMPTVGCVVLTMGTRPVELERSVQSLLAQTGVETNIVVVGNGWDPVNIPVGASTHYLPENIGATAGRNAGAAVINGDFNTGYYYYSSSQTAGPSYYGWIQTFSSGGVVSNQWTDTGMRVRPIRAF